jgi:hypothetical protein
MLWLRATCTFPRKPSSRQSVRERLRIGALPTQAGLVTPSKAIAAPSLGFINFFILPGASWNLNGPLPVDFTDKPSMEGVMENWTNAKLCDAANLVLGAVLFVSPWMFGFDAGKVSQNAMIIGLVITILAIAALAAFAVWEEWLNLIVGLWALVSPWVLGFQGTTAMTVHALIGAAVAVLAAIEIWITTQNPPRLTTGR